MTSSSPDQPFRRFPLHWVFKIGSLEQTINFYEKVFGMKIHRHEEFGSGCEATCNGPYGGAWSKTMVGYGTEITNTSLELTYNYGIPHYDIGNDYRYIAIAARDFGVKAEKGGFNVSAVLPGGYRVVTSPDGYRYLLVPGTTGSNPEDPFLFVSLNVTNLQNSLKYYTEVLGFKVFKNVPGALNLEKSAVIGFDEHTFKIELVELTDGIALDHKKGIGRLAIETEDEAPATVGDIVKKAGHKINHGPFKLPPHSEHVVIVADPDGYEYCFVAQTGYRAGSLSVTNKTIDWTYRNNLNAKALAATSTSTPTPTPTPAPSAAPASAPQVFFVNATAADFENLVKTTDKIVVLKFSATWCRPCKILAPFCEKVAADYKDDGVFLTVDLDEAEELAKSLSIDSVPAIKFFKNGVALKQDFLGAKKDPESDLRAVFKAVFGK